MLHSLQLSWVGSKCRILVDDWVSVDNGYLWRTSCCRGDVMGNENYGKIDRTSYNKPDPLIYKTQYYQGSEDKKLPRMCMMCHTQVFGTMEALERHVTNNHPKVWNGYDYTNQAWIIAGVYVKCACPEPGTLIDPSVENGGPGGKPYIVGECGCYGRLHEGEPPMIGASIH